MKPTLMYALVYSDPTYGICVEAVSADWDTLSELKAIYSRTHPNRDARIVVTFLRERN